MVSDKKHAEERVVGPYGDRIARVIFAAKDFFHQSFGDGLHIVDQSGRAKLMHCSMLHAAEIEFGRDGEIRFRVERQLMLMQIRDHTAVRFKKLDDRHHSRNLPTMQQASLWKQEPLPGLPDTVKVFVAGYRLDAVGMVRDTYLTKQTRAGASWIIRLPGREQLDLAPPLLEHPHIADDGLGFTLRPRGEESERDEAGGERT